MTPPVGANRRQHSAEHVRLARRVVGKLGGRYSTELGIDVDAGDADIERWFPATTLFGTGISAAVAERTFRVLSDAGLTRIGQARHIPEEDFIACLDEGGYARYDARTATRLRALPEVIGERYDGRAAAVHHLPALRAALDVAQPPLDQRAAFGAWHLGRLGTDPAPADLPRLAQPAAGYHTDPGISKAGWSGSSWRTTDRGRVPARADTFVPCSRSSQAGD